MKHVFFLELLNVKMSAWIRLVHESSRGPVSVAGSFNDWKRWEMNEVSGGKYQIHLPLPPGIYEYKFRIGDDWFPPWPEANRYFTVEPLYSQGLPCIDQVCSSSIFPLKFLA